MSKLLSALLEAKRNITAPAKNKKANYGRYADLEAILTAVEGPLAEQGLVITQQVQPGEDGGNYLVTKLHHVESDEAIDSAVPLLQKSPNDPQQLGGAITYARRYGITALLSIVADDDDDGNTSAGKNKDGSKKPAQKPEKPVTQEKIAEVMKGGDLDPKLVSRLVDEYKRADFAESEIVPELKALIKREFKQISELTEAEARTAVGHARKVKAGDEEKLV